MMSISKRLLAILMVMALMLPVLASAQGTDASSGKTVSGESTDIAIRFDREVVNSGETLGVTWDLPIDESQISWFRATWGIKYADGSSATIWSTDEICDSASLKVEYGVRGYFHVDIYDKEDNNYWGMVYIDIVGAPELPSMDIIITPDKTKAKIGDTINYDIQLVNFKQPLQYYYCSILVMYGSDAWKEITEYNEYAETVSYEVTEGTIVQLSVVATDADGRNILKACNVEITDGSETAPAIRITTDKTEFSPGESVTIRWDIDEYDAAVESFVGDIYGIGFDEEYIPVAEISDTDLLTGEKTVTVPAARELGVWCDVCYTDRLQVSADEVFEIDNPNVPVQEISLSMEKITIGKGQKVNTVKAVIYPENAADKSVVWTSSDEKVATVDSKGNIKGVGKGEAVVTATSVSDPDCSDTVLVEVAGKNKGVKKITLNKKKASVKVGKTVKLKATISPAKAADKKIVWYSDNSEVASVDSKGKVTANSVGKTTIWAVASSGVKAKCTVTVKEAKVTKITIEGKKKMDIGDTQQLTVIVKPDAAANKEVKWKSSNPKVATVDENGVVTAIKKGKTTITAIARDGSKVKGKIVIKVRK